VRPDDLIDPAVPEADAVVPLPVDLQPLDAELEQKKEKNDEEVKSFDVAHHVGLSLEEEYEMLHLLQERQRQEYLKRHLTKVIPLVAEMEQLKEKIKLNGHFKNLSGLGFGHE